MNETILNLTARIVTAHIANNTVRADQLPTLIKEVHRTLSTVGKAAAEPAKAEPAVEVRKSVFADHLVCLACGKSFKTIKRHLMSDHQLTPEQYRSTYGLPHGYPMVAPAYAKVRSAFAKKIGLGRGAHRRGRAAKKVGRKRG
jgi:predicted transcriptional regulator